MAKNNKVSARRKISIDSSRAAASLGVSCSKPVADTPAAASAPSAASAARATKAPEPIHFAGDGRTPRHHVYP